MNMNDNHINKHMFNRSLSKSGHNVKNWYYRVDNFYKKLISMPHLSNPAYNFNVDYVLDDMRTVLSEHY